MVEVQTVLQRFAAQLGAAKARYEEMAAAAYLVRYGKVPTIVNVTYGSMQSALYRSWLRDESRKNRKRRLADRRLLAEHGSSERTKELAAQYAQLTDLDPAAVCVQVDAIGEDGTTRVRYCDVPFGAR